MPTDFPICNLCLPFIPATSRPKKYTFLLLLKNVYIVWQAPGGSILFYKLITLTSFDLLLKTVVCNFNSLLLLRVWELILNLVGILIDKTDSMFKLDCKIRWISSGGEFIVGYICKYYYFTKSFIFFLLPRKALVGWPFIGDSNIKLFDDYTTDTMFITP